MSLTSPIPKKIRDELSEDPFMKKCCIADSYCEGKIEWHHALTFAGKRVNEPWCILPVCKKHHKLEAQNRVELIKVMVRRASEDDLKPYCKAIDYIAIRKRYE